MRRYIPILLSLLLVMIAGVAASQQFMLLENPQNLKNFKYYKGDDIRLRIKSDKRSIEGEITGFTDSSLFVGEWEEVMFEEIRSIYRARFWIMLSRGLFLAAGVGYFSVDAFNRLINDDAPVILMETVAISIGLVGANFLLIPLRYKRLDTEKWKIRLIDFNELDPYRLTIP